MADKYRLLFRGEVAEGQHVAVVKRKVGELLKLEGEKLDRLFSGDPIVLRKETDKATAAKFQTAFKKSGARLRVQALEAAQAAAEEPRSAKPATPPDDSLTILPVGSDLLTDAERPQVKVQEVDTSHLKMQGATFGVSESEEIDTPVDAPDTSHLEVMEVGVDLGTGDVALETLELDVDFDLAEPGALLLGEELLGEELLEDTPQTIPAAAPDADFDLADPGARIGPESDADSIPPPPNTDHIQLKE